MKKIIVSLFFLISFFTLIPTSIMAHENVDEILNQYRASSLQAISGTFSDYIPYTQFNNYQYVGYGDGFDNQYLILEYSPDDQGFFQIVDLMGNEANAVIYQQRSNGLFEVGRVWNYAEVQDLRYSDQVRNNGESMVLSNDLSIGHQFQSGFNKERTREVVAILPSYQCLGIHYSEVVVLLESNNYDNSKNILYFAPRFGMIERKKFDNNGQLYGQMSLQEVYNDVMND